MNSSGSPVIEIRNLVYRYAKASDESGFSVTLKSLSLKRGEVAALTGVSGSGKSTLLECIGLIREATEAEVFSVSGQQALSLSRADKAALRAGFLGFMPQSGGLLPYLTVRDNIRLQIELALKARLAKADSQAVSEYLEGILPTVEKFGMLSCLDKYPEELSIGQRQRAVFFKALSHKPALILIDEPTSSLDPANADRLFDTIIDSCVSLETSALMVSHDVAALRAKGIREYAYSTALSTVSHSVFSSTEEDDKESQSQDELNQEPEIRDSENEHGGQS